MSTCRRWSLRASRPAREASAFRLPSRVWARERGVR